MVISAASASPRSTRIVVVVAVVPMRVTDAANSTSSSKWSGVKKRTVASATNMSIPTSVTAFHEPNISRYSSVIAMSA